MLGYYIEISHNRSLSDPMMEPKKQKVIRFVSSAAMMMVTINITVFRDGTLCSLIES
jgi:hypothetical protein